MWHVKEVLLQLKLSNCIRRERLSVLKKQFIVSIVIMIIIKYSWLNIWSGTN